jgi:tetratricopeptide (TPR) repeat protein/DNA-binding CsgD family transcriptional regulator
MFVVKTGISMISIPNIRKLMVVVFFILAHHISFCQEKALADSLILKLKAAENDSASIYINIELSRFYTTSDLSKALEYAENAVELAEKSGNTEMLSKSLNNIGNVYFNQGFFELALAQYYRNLEIQKSAGNEKGIASALINIGAISLNMNEFEKAKKNFKEALITFKELERSSADKKYSAEIITSYNNLGIACQNLKEQKQSEIYYQTGIDQARKTLGNSSLLANLLNNLASLLLDQKQPDKAYNPIKEALDIRLQIGDKNGEAQSYRMLAIYYIEKGNTTKALEYLYKGYDLAQSIGNISLQSSLVNKLFIEYDKMGKSDSALKYHIILKSLEAEMNSEETRRELTRIELTAQFKEKEQIRELAQQKKETRYLIIGISLVVSLAILGLLFLLSQNRLKRMRLEKDIADLASKNLELENNALQKELELRNKELTTNVMYLVQKNEYITDLAEQVISIKKYLPENSSHIVDRLIYDLKSNRDDKIWKEFEIRFQEVHQDFYSRLNEQFPDLTPNEKKLAAFLRLNMTTKDISAITFQLPDSIKTARSRLRKKLGLPQEANIIAFLESI